jgi:hypothetical protein
MKTQSSSPEKPYFFKHTKAYTAEEIMAAGGTTAFGNVSDYDRQLLYNLAGEPLSEEDYQQALAKLSR